MSKISQKVFVDYVPPPKSVNLGDPSAVNNPSTSITDASQPPTVPPKLGKRPPPPPPPAMSSEAALVVPPPASVVSNRPKISVPVGVFGASSSSGPYPAMPPAPNPDFQGELKEKCMTFFSSVTRARADDPDEQNPAVADNKGTTKL